MKRVLQLWLCLLPMIAGARELPRVVVLKSADLGAYGALVAGFTSEARAEIDQILLPRHPDEIARVVERVKAGKPALVLAVGPSAANAASRGLGEIPVLFTMVPYYERYSLEGPNVVGIALTNDFSPELSALVAALPNVKRVGVLHDPRYSLPQLEDIRLAAQQLELNIVPLAAADAAAAKKALAGVTAKVDALLMVSDRTVGSAEVVRELIETSRTEQIPLVALASTQVQEGALLSLSPSYLGLGQQAGRLANRLIHERVDPSALAVARPEALELSINLAQARSLGKRAPVTEGLLTHAADKGLTIRVFP
ncbi:MAG TPA: ABC transporter substrate binding protein [Myxococcaceae bacterium]|nr:ABC transporter substrate binding protein [Myxococcaceae bacterium]